MKRALILGPGQDGSYLCDILLERGVEVHVLHRHSSVDNLVRIRHCLDRVTLHRGDLVDFQSVRNVIFKVQPDEIFNVADQDHIGWSSAAPSYQKMVTSNFVFNLLSYLCIQNSRAKVFQPLSVTMFGTSPPPHNENAQCNPQSPYAKEKLRAWEHCNSFRGDVRVWCGIMCNHDSPRRNGGYLLQDVCRQAVEVARGRRDAVVVGSLDTRVDVGYARDYMEAAVDMLQLDRPDDYVIGTGVAWTIGAMCDWALNCVGRPISGRIRVDPALAGTGPRPTYVADIGKAKAAFGFAPRHGVGDVIKMLVEHFKETLK